MTVKQLTITTADKLYIVDLYGTRTELNTESPLTIAAYGDLVIDTLRASDRNEIEITIKFQPVKEG